MNLPNALTVGRIAVDAAHRGAAARRLVDAAAHRVRAVHRRRGHRLRRRTCSRGRASRRPTSAGCSIRSPTSCCSSGRSSRCICSRRRFPFVTPHRRRSDLPLWIVARRARPRGVHDALSPGRGATRRRDRRDRPGEVEDGVPARSGRAARTSGSSRRRSPQRKAGTATLWHAFAQVQRHRRHC